MGSTLVAAFWALVGAIASYVGKVVLDAYIANKSKTSDVVEARRDSDVKKIESISLEVRDMACNYWSFGGVGAEQVRLAASITGRLYFLTYLIEELFRDHISEWSSVREILIDLDNACTSTDFLVERREAKPERCEFIELQAYRFIHFTSSYRRQLPK